jgi:hypothetical protein
MSSAFDNANDFQALLDAMCDRPLTSEEVERVEQSIRSDQDARRRYCLMATLCAELEWVFPMGAETRLVRATQTEGVVLPGSTRSWRISNRSLVAIVAAASVAVACWLALGAWVFPRWRAAQQLAGVELLRGKIDANEPVASLVAEHGCRWRAAGDRAAKVGTEFSVGTMLELETGVAQLQFVEGAHVWLEGPAWFTVESQGRGNLARGKLVAQVPKDAIGFTVETPTAQVVDLGTEFGVEVDESGATDVQVSKGKVQLRSEGSQDGTNSPSIILSAGAAQRIEINAAGKPVVREIRYQQQPFSNLQQIATNRLPVRGAIASSEFPHREVRHLIDGSGLSEGQHTNQPVETMWASAGHDTTVKHEYVLFDFGRVCQLESIKVWNYNEGGFGLNLLRGVKQADIYVSKSGKSDPLKQPEEWALVVGGYKFTAADGTPNYATPDLIAMGGVEARFVAIVVDEPFGKEPPETRTGQQYVGLSEVQFFGRKSERPRPKTETRFVPQR